ncbi:GNAT family N-acetyltransferase [Actinoplanes teichomyceticus]|uniref:Acetyltransferase (GNAT) family protein n=1 Tax=Actinoplanes teichomyceticus TaxID=1867 RepID=A0A561VSB3_ACTTI|nr:GNAT family N-acetyltransferase [Actinoplanes teichomyceticus]TWG14493.1 acetyltransferase (GNAT) family protein [Actinoplanes teichomyceticus]GIF16298.1 N-acetyltransferase [Actinoplanes teichomyceticus]
MTLDIRHNVHIRKARKRPRDSDVAALATVLSSAFMHADLADYLIPDWDERRTRYPDYFALLAEHALTTAHVDLLTIWNHSIIAGAAVWYQVDEDGLPDPEADYGHRLSAAAGPAMERFTALKRAMHEHHPRAEPHDYLAYLAVRPPYRRYGFASRLLDHRHQQLNAAGRPAYLEATGDHNRALYAAHEYLELDPYPIAADGPHLFPMWRKPSNAA